MILLLLTTFDKIPNAPCSKPWTKALTIQFCIQPNHHRPRGHLTLRLCHVYSTNRAFRIEANCFFQTATVKHMFASPQGDELRWATIQIFEADTAWAISKPRVFRMGEFVATWPERTIHQSLWRGHILETCKSHNFIAHGVARQLLLIVIGIGASRHTTCVALPVVNALGSHHISEDLFVLTGCKEWIHPNPLRIVLCGLRFSETSFWSAKVISQRISDQLV